MTHPALKNAPKTPIEAINRIREHLASGKVARQRYKQGECRCAIGIFFTDDQIEQIMKQDLNMMNIGYLARIVGIRNIEAMTCLPMKDLYLIQQSLDDNGKENLAQQLDILEKNYQ